ncbi:uroporphyrinogen-III synthase [Croceivirga thetidis]|uniref:Uroporphyrinogen-III synthase n=1 Tax=Croceivirga thetidis TaxID=2721623 RepID=A0ABX1GN67_9FLAO|nr:uroporphyrinogen-III synthase [Croceivirga thetidis]NKI31079.1 uroporphyrinogen-III synthase [Croceivirga thetidis]
MKSVLSTKVLTHSQQELLLNAGLGFTHYNAIKIAFLDFEMPEEDFDFYIFTSQNAVNSHIKAQPDFKQKEVFCVGEKTKSLLEENGLKVREIAENSLKLAQIILKRYQNNSFLHIAGNLKTKDLPTILTKYNIRYIEIEGYQTFLNSKVFNQQFDGTLFFSPSGVISFTKSNKLTGNAFCIGATTANEARKFTDKIIIAKKPTIENVIVQAVKNLKHD